MAPCRPYTPESSDVSASYINIIYKKVYIIYSLIYNYNNNAYKGVIKPNNNNESKSINNNEF